MVHNFVKNEKKILLSNIFSFGNNIIVNTKSKFIIFYQNFNIESHFAELADGSRINNMV